MAAAPRSSWPRTASDCFRRATIPHLHAVRELFIDALSPEQLAAADDIAATLRRHLDRSRQAGCPGAGPSGNDVNGETVG